MKGTDLTPDIPGNLTDEDESWIKNSLSLCLEGVLLPILALFGIVGKKSRYVCSTVQRTMYII